MTLPRPHGPIRAMMRRTTRDILIRVALGPAGSLLGMAVGREWGNDTAGLIIGGAFGNAAADILIDHINTPDTAAPKVEPLPLVLPNEAPRDRPRTPGEFSTPVRELIVQVNPG